MSATPPQAWIALHAQCRVLGLRLCLGVIDESPDPRHPRGRLGVVSVWARDDVVGSVDIARFGGSLDAVARYLAPWVDEWRRYTGRGVA